MSKSGSGKSGPKNAEDRLRQLLVMLPWLMEQGEVPLAEVAERFNTSESQVAKDLELVAMCGLPPYVDEMIDVFVDEGMVFVGVPRLFTRALRLTAPEGFALLAAGRAAMELPGADPGGPLARGLSKLADTLGRAGLDAGVDDTTGLAVDLGQPRFTDEVVAATADGRELRISYFSPSRGAAAERTIVPRHVFADAGNWYVLADDATSNERRTFRIDRVEMVEDTGVVHPVDTNASAPEGFFTDPELPRATLRLATRAQWIIDRYPIDSVRPVSSASDMVDVELAVGSDWWLNRLMVRLGPDARLLAPQGGDAGARELAAAILANY